MIKRKILRIIAMINAAFAIPTLVSDETVGVFFDSNVPQIKFAADNVKTALESKGFTVEMNALSKLISSYSNKKIVIALASNSDVARQIKAEGGKVLTGLGEQGLRNTHYHKR